MLPALPDWAWKLVKYGPEPPPRLLDGVRREGEAAREPLCALVRGDYAVGGEFPDEGWARVHALELLGELQPDAASLGLCIVILFDPGVDYLTDTARRVAEAWANAWGSRMVPDLLAAHEAAPPEGKIEILCLLAAARTRDPRIYERLVAALPADTERVADALAEYGDPAALPLLSRALDDYAFDGQIGLFCDQETIEIAAAIERLGGVLTDSHRAKLESMRRRRRRYLRSVGLDPDDLEPIRERLSSAPWPDEARTGRAPTIEAACRERARLPSGRAR